MRTRKARVKLRQGALITLLGLVGSEGLGTLTDECQSALHFAKCYILQRFQRLASERVGTPTSVTSGWPEHKQMCSFT